MMQRWIPFALLTACVMVPMPSHARVVVTESTWWMIPVHMIGIWVALGMAARRNQGFLMNGLCMATGWVAAGILLLVPIPVSVRSDDPPLDGGPRFGLFKSKTEKMVLKLERQMMAIENFFDQGKYDIARQAVHEQLQTLRWLHYEGDWPEEKINRYLLESGLVRSVHDKEYRDEIALKLMVM